MVTAVSVDPTWKAWPYVYIGTEVTSNVAVQPWVRTLVGADYSTYVSIPKKKESDEMQPYQFVIWVTPSDEDRKFGKTEEIIQHGFVMAKSDADAKFRAGMLLQKPADPVHRIDIAVRSFA